MHFRGFILFVLLHFVHPKVLDLSCKEIRAFIDGHNSRRLSLAKGNVQKQPAASEMKYMIWDKELAAKASKWASTNQLSHNPDRTIGSGRFTTGENIYMAGSTDLNWKINVDSALQSWFDEHKDYTYGPIKISDFNGSNKAIGHYTQMAWSDSVYIGCGISENQKNGMKEYYVVCNYGPPGNYLGQTPYKASGSGSGKLICSTKDCSRPYGDNCK
ncbi:venom allergen 5-like [Nymphalis io]|uniref:venom allergen 5-like n=1 Tax=Inachis io TaxID=171585 RepID=UPI002167B68F|nr:venom allergen 5-like [Nymphalis io]